MRLGLGSYTFGWAVGVEGYPPGRPLDENGLLDKVRRAGLSVLQIGDNLPLHLFGMNRLQDLAGRATREGIQLEIGARRLTPERVSEYVGIARHVGARLIRFVIDDTDYHPDPDTVTGVLRESAALLGDLTLAIENHDRFPAATFRSMIEATGDDRIGVCLDTANSLGAGEGISAVASVLAPLTVNLHLKDFRVQRVPHLMGFVVSGCPAGCGLMDLPRLLEELSRFGRCKTAILEQWTTPEPQIDQTIAKEDTWASQSLQYLEPFFH